MIDFIIYWFIIMFITTIFSYIIIKISNKKEESKLEKFFLQYQLNTFDIVSSPGFSLKPEYHKYLKRRNKTKFSNINIEII